MEPVGTEGGAVGTADAARDRAPLRRTTVLTAALVGWSLFVWGGRIRNTLSDDTLGGSERLGPQLLALSFVVPAMGLVLLLLRRRQQPSDPGRARAFTIGLRVLAAWTTGVWILRAGDIALGGDHELGFVVVHLVLAVVSIGLSAGAVLADDRSARALRRVPVGVR